jgi:hypothetical protein
MCLVIWKLQTRRVRVSAVVEAIVMPNTRVALPPPPPAALLFAELIRSMLTLGYEHESVHVLGDKSSSNRGLPPRAQPARLRVHETAEWRAGETMRRQSNETAEQQNSRTAEQQNSRTAEQQNSRTAEQQNSRTAVQQLHEVSCYLEIATASITITVLLKR